MIQIRNRRASLDLVGGTRPFDGTLAELPFWLENRDDGRSLLFRYSEVRDGPRESVDEFADRLGEALARPPVERLVIDLRGNRGGDQGLNLPLLHATVRSPLFDRPAALFVRIDRVTFSAAMNFALDLERHTAALFVGEPTGGRPKRRGDARKPALPATGLTVRVASLYSQLSDPGDAREAIEPELPVPVLSRHRAAGRDHVLAEALRREGPGAEILGGWTGALLDGGRRFPVALLGEAGAEEGRRIRLVLRPAGGRLLGFVRLSGHRLPLVLERTGKPLEPAHGRRPAG